MAISSPTLGLVLHCPAPRGGSSSHISAISACGDFRLNMLLCRALDVPWFVPATLNCTCTYIIYPISRVRVRGNAPRRLEWRISGVRWSSPLSAGACRFTSCQALVADAEQKRIFAAKVIASASPTNVSDFGRRRFWQNGPITSKWSIGRTPLPRARSNAGDGSERRFMPNVPMSYVRDQQCALPSNC
jgi:hypothetical protein